MGTMAAIGMTRIGMIVGVAGAIALVAAAPASALPAAAAPAAAAYVHVGVAPGAVAYSPDSSTVYVANEEDGSVSVIDAATRTVSATVSVGKTPFALAISPDGANVYVADYGSAAVSVIDAATDTVTQTIPVATSPGGLALSPDGTTLYVSSFTASNVTAYNAMTGATLSSAPVGNGPFPVAVARDGTVMVTSANAGNVTFLSADLATNLGSVSVGGFPQGMAVSAGGTTLAVTSVATHRVTLIDVSSRTVEQTDTVGPSPIGVALSADASRAFVANGTGPLSVIDIATGTITGPPADPGSGALALAPNGLGLAVTIQNDNSTGTNNTIALFDVPGVGSPANASVSVGQAASFTVVASNDPDAITWQRSTDGGATWTDIAGASGVTYTFTAALADSGDLFRAAAVSALFGDAPGGAATLTVTAPATPSPTPTQPAASAGGGAMLAESGSDLSWPASFGFGVLGVGALVLVAASALRRDATR